MSSLMNPAANPSKAFDSGVNFSIAPVFDENTPSKYCLRVDFPDEIPPMNVLFQKSAYTEERDSVDIASVNAQTRKNQHQTLRQAFSKEDIKDIQGSLELTTKQREEPNTQTVAVFDLKTSKFYSEKDKIKKDEECVLERLKSSCSQGNLLIDQAREIFIKNNVRFLIKEGSLKADILTSSLVTPDQVNFFSNGHGTAFCQLTEFFMNAAKFGDTVVSDPTLNPPSYITALQGGSDFMPVVRSYVAYPPSYRDMALGGEYTAAMKASEVFRTQVQECEGGFILGDFQPLI